MKKIWLFTISTFIALAIAFYSKRSPTALAYSNKAGWKTFEKKENKGISGHLTTPNELILARIPVIKREIAQEKKGGGNETDKGSSSVNHYLYRFDRVLIGDIQKNNYQDEQVELEMINKPNSNWKEILGNDLVRFQAANTKVLIKEEFPVIKIQHGKGLYCEQVIVTYLLNNGDQNSFRALVDSESGKIFETWDKSIHERFNTESTGFTLPTENESGIIAR